MEYVIQGGVSVVVSILMLENNCVEWNVFLGFLTPGLANQLYSYGIVVNLH